MYDSNLNRTNIKTIQKSKPYRLRIHSNLIHFYTKEATKDNIFINFLDLFDEKRLENSEKFPKEHVLCHDFEAANQQTEEPRDKIR